MSNTNTPDADEAAMFDEDGAYESALEHLTEIERLGSLEADGRIAAGITLELQDHGPLYQFVKLRRLEAIEALRVLVDTPPDSAENVTALIEAQASFKEFRKVTRFIHSGLRNGELAEEIIKEEYGYEPGQDGDLIQDAPEPSWRRRR